MKKSLITIAVVCSMGFTIGVQATPVDEARSTDADIEIIMIPVINPLTGKLENRPCSTWPACEHDGAMLDLENEKDEQE